MDSPELIALHELCETCQRFDDSCLIFEHLMQDGCNADSPHADMFEFSHNTFGEIRTNSEFCHLCALFLITTEDLESDGRHSDDITKDDAVATLSIASQPGF